MLEHRFRDLAFSPSFGVASSAAITSGFVACPLPQGYSTTQVAQVQEIYRIAAERAREQLTPRRRRIPEFSRN